MKPIHLTQLVGAYVSLAPLTAAWIVYSSNSYVSPFGVEGVIYIGAQIMLVCGYSQAGGGRRPWNNPRLFWTVSFVINLLIFAGALRMSGSSPVLEKVMFGLTYFRDTFYPVPKPAEMLRAIGGLAWVLAVFWMPVAALLSFVAGAGAWRSPAKASATPPVKAGCDPHDR